MRLGLDRRQGATVMLRRRFIERRDPTRAPNPRRGGPVRKSAGFCERALRRGPTAARFQPCSGSCWTRENLSEGPKVTAPRCGATGEPLDGAVNRAHGDTLDRQAPEIESPGTAPFAGPRTGSVALYPSPDDHARWARPAKARRGETAMVWLRAEHGLGYVPLGRLTSPHNRSGGRAP